MKTAHTQIARDRNYFRCRKVPYNTDRYFTVRVIRTPDDPDFKYFLLTECGIIPRFRLKEGSLFKLTQQISAVGSQLRRPGIHGEVINYQVHDPS